VRRKGGERDRRSVATLFPANRGDRRGSNPRQLEPQADQEGAHRDDLCGSAALAQPQVADAAAAFCRRERRRGERGARVSFWRFVPIARRVRALIAATSIFVRDAARKRVLVVTSSEPHYYAAYRGTMSLRSLSN
jgi:hypothetical protein